MDLNTSQTISTKPLVGRVPPIATGAGAIPFNRPYMVGTELEYVRQAHANLQLAGDGSFTARCSQWLERTVGCQKALLTHSCTAALEMAAILARFCAGSEHCLSQRNLDTEQGDRGGADRHRHGRGKRRQAMMAYAVGTPPPALT